MRIAVLTHEFAPFDGGVARVVAELTGEAVRQGHEVTIHAPDYGRDDLPEGAGGARVVRFRGGRFEVRRDLLRYAGAVHRFLARVPADVIHLADWPPFLAAALSPLSHRRIASAFGVATIYGTDVRILARRRPAAALTRRTLGACARLAAISAYTARLAADCFPSLPPAEVVHLGVSPHWRAEPIPTAAGDPLLVLGVGRLVPDKGHAAVIEAIAGLPAELRGRMEYALVGTGEPGYAAELGARAREGGVRVSLRGRLTDEALRELYRRAWVHVLASREHSARVEGFGLVVLEAALAQVPTIGTRVGGITELIEPGRTGFLVPQDDAAGIRAALAALAADASLRERMGRAALAHAERFTWRRAAERTYGT